MSEINKQNQNNIIAPLKERNLETKKSLEQINQILEDLHKKILKESSSKNVIKSLEMNENEENIKNENEMNEKKNENEYTEKENKELDTKKEIKNMNKRGSEESIKSSDSEKISNININKIKNANDYKSSMDINILNSIGVKKKNKINKKNTKEEKEKKEKLDNDNNKNAIKEDKKEDIKNNNNNIKQIDDITQSNIFPEEINSFNIDKQSEFYLNEIIDKLGGVEQSSSIKEDEIFNISKENSNKIKEKENNSDSVKNDSNEDLKLRLTNIPLSEEKDNTSLITNELNKAYLKTKDYISNISSDIPRDNEKDGLGKIEKKLTKKSSKSSSNEKKFGFEIFLQKEPLDTAAVSFSWSHENGLPRDSVQVEVPIEQKTYEGENYRAVVQGFRPELVSIDIRQQTVTVTEYKRKWWSVTIGPQLGYGFTPAGWQPYAGIGASVGISF